MTMNKLKMHSPDITQENIAKLAELFPGCVTEAHDESGQLKRAIDFDQLRQELSDHVVDGPRERYQLNWPGKREALLAANAPIAKTLRPCREESVDFDTTKNLFIEGDNLDALKLLQETYLNKIKMIYIDPPYNTGNDFVYDDDFSTDGHSYFYRSAQADESGGRLVANTEANGRFHSDWLSMMFSRLKLARNLLCDDGLILISIDDQEVHNLRRMCDEILGRDKFLAAFVWKSRQNKDNRTTTGASIDHEYILCYGKQIRGDERNRGQYRNPDNDTRGDWASANMVGIATKDRRPNLHYDLIDPETGVNYGCPEMGWRYDRKSMSRLISENRILWPDEQGGRPRRKAFLNELESAFTGYSTFIGTGVFTRDGTADVSELFGARVFTFPKPVRLLTELIEQGTSGDDIVLDFFAGSGTTAEAVIKKNSEDGGRRQFVVVQLAEELDPANPNQKTAADFCDKLGMKRAISELSKERIRRAGRKTKEGAGLHGQNLDVGFRVLKIDTSNMKDVFYRPDTLNKDDLFDHIENIKEDRTPEDLLFQVLLDWGVDLSLPICKESICPQLSQTDLESEQENHNLRKSAKSADVRSFEVFFVDENALAACFDTGVTEELVKKIAARKPLRVVFRDAGFSDDSVKINVEQIFKLMSPDTEVKAI